MGDASHNKNDKSVNQSKPAATTTEPTKPAATL